MNNTLPNYPLLTTLYKYIPFMYANSLKVLKIFHNFSIFALTISMLRSKAFTNSFLKVSGMGSPLLSHVLQSGGNKATPMAFIFDCCIFNVLQHIEFTHQPCYLFCCFFGNIICLKNSINLSLPYSPSVSEIIS